MNWVHLVYSKPLLKIKDKNSSTPELFLKLDRGISKQFQILKWNKVFKNGPSKTCGIQSLKN